MSVDARTTGMGLWTDSREYFEAAELVLGSSKLALANPVFYLLGHGLEVAFKAYLRSNSYSLNELRVIGHNLEGAAQKSLEEGLSKFYPLSESELAEISTLNAYYKAKHFEYRVTGYKQLPAPRNLLALGNRLLAGIRPICEASVGIVPI